MNDAGMSRTRATWAETPEPSPPAPAARAALHDWRAAHRDLARAREAYRTTRALSETLGDLWDAAIVRAGDAEQAAAKALHLHGPVEHDGQRYEGACLAGVWSVVQAAAPGVDRGGEVVAAHASCDVAGGLREDDGELQ